VGLIAAGEKDYGLYHLITGQLGFVSEARNGSSFL
jgi:hypothetical protein